MKRILEEIKIQNQIKRLNQLCVSRIREMTYTDDKLMITFKEFYAHNEHMKNHGNV